MERELVILQALKVVPDVIDALAFEAKKGNVQACKLVLEVAGLIGPGRVNPTNPTVEILREELARLEKALADMEN